MSPPIRVKPSLILSTSLRGSILDGAYTAGVAYASPLRRGQIPPRLVMFFAVFTTLVLLVSNFNRPTTVQPLWENQTFTDDYGSATRALGSFDDVPWILPPRYWEPVELSPAATRLLSEKCPLGPPPIKDDICGFDKAVTNFTQSPDHSIATYLDLTHSMPIEEFRSIELHLAALALCLLTTLWALHSNKQPRSYFEILRLPRTFYTDNPTSKSFVETWDSSNSPFIPWGSREQIHFPEHEEVIRTIHKLSASPSNIIPTSSPSTNPSLVDTLHRFIARILTCGMELVADINGRMPVEQGNISGHTFGTTISTSVSSTSSFDQAYEDFEVEEIGIDYC